MFIVLEYGVTKHNVVAEHLICCHDPDVAPSVKLSVFVVTL